MTNLTGFRECGIIGAENILGRTRVGDVLSGKLDISIIDTSDPSSARSEVSFLWPI